MIGGSSGFPTIPVSSSLLATVPSINLKNTGATTLFTVPSGLSLMVTDVVLLVTAANTITIAPIVSIGQSASYNEYVPLTTMTGLNAVNQYYQLSLSAAALIHKTFSTGTAVALNVGTGATATTLTVTAYIFGLTF